MEYLFFYIGFGVLCGILAQNRGRNPLGWFFLSLTISFILATIILFVLPKIEESVEVAKND